MAASVDPISSCDDVLVRALQVAGIVRQRLADQCTPAGAKRALIGVEDKRSRYRRHAGIAAAILRHRKTRVAAVPARSPWASTDRWWSRRSTGIGNSAVAGCTLV